MIKCLFITYHGGAGGVSVLLYNIIQSVQKKGLKDIQIDICYASKKLVIGEEIEKNGVNVTCLEMKSGFDLFLGLLVRTL